MQFEQIRDHFRELMPENLCASSVDFFNAVEKKEELVKHLKSYHHWSIYKNLLTRQNLEILGVEFGNERGIFIGNGDGLGAIARDIEIKDDGGFVFQEAVKDLCVYGDNPFLYLRQTYVTRLFIGGNVKHLSLLPDTRVGEMIVIGKVETLRLYDSSISSVILEKEVPGAEVKRLIFGRGGRIDHYERSDFGRIVGD